MSKYEDALYTAHMHEKAGRLKAAIKALDVAEKRTGDADELFHLRHWRARLQKQADITPPAAPGNGAGPSKGAQLRKRRKPPSNRRQRRIP